MLDISVEDVEKRMNSLRTVYRKIITGKGSGSAYETLTVSQKKTVNLCSFLKNHLQGKETVSNLDMDEDDQVL